MVTKRNRPQVGFNPQGPGLATRKAANVPFIPATRRSGVGDNEQRMGSALMRLGSALGSFSAKLEAEDKRDVHAERRRVSQWVAKKSKLTPDERVAERQKFGITPVSDGIKELQRVREEDVPLLKKQIDAKFAEWASAGWTSLDEDGKRIPVTEEDIKAYFTELGQANIYDKYSVKGENGRLHRPQVQELTRHLDHYRAEFVTKWTAYKHKELQRDGYETVEKNAEDSLVEGYFAKNLRGQQLLEAWMEGGKRTFSAVVGNKTIQPGSRSDIFKKQLEGFYRKMDSIGDVRLFQELLDAKIPGSGAKLRDAYPEIVPRILAKGGKILKGALEVEEKERHTSEALTALGKNGEYDFSSKTIRLPDGTTKTYSKKEQQTAVIEKIKEAARVEAGSEQDPSKKWIEHQRTLTALTGTSLVDDEIKDRFSSAAFGNAAQNESDFNQLLTLYRDIKTIDPTKLDKYITDPDVRNRLRNIERMLDHNPRLGIQGALEVIQNGTGEDGKPHSWESFHPDLKTAFRSFKKEKEFLRDGFTPEEVEDLDATLRLRLADPNERRKLDADGSGYVDRSEFRTAIEEERDNIKSQRALINGSIVRPPPGENAERYKVKIERFMGQLSKQLSVSEDDMRIKSLPNNAGLVFTDKNGTPLVIKKDGKEYKAVFGHRQLLEWTHRSGNAALFAKSIRKGGLAQLNRTAEENLKKVEEARKSTKEIRSWWNFWSSPASEEPPKLIQKPTEVK